jgi:hypothetical protein
MDDIHSEDIGNNFRAERIVNQFEPARLVVEVASFHHVELMAERQDLKLQGGASAE